MNRIYIPWYSSEEVLPEHDMYCLVSTHAKTILVARYRQQNNSFYEGTNRSKLDVVGWSYLPEPYKEDVNGN
jgi:hypothetical protein